MYKIKEFDQNKIKAGTHLKLENNDQIYQMVGYTKKNKCILQQIPYKYHENGMMYLDVCQPDDVEAIIERKPEIILTEKEYFDILISTHGG